MKLNSDGFGNVFTRMLKLLEIEHTEKFATNMYETHPGKKSFLGLTELFSTYKIETSCYKFNSDTTIEELPTPFIAILAGELFVIEIIEGEKIKVFFEGGSDFIRKSSFYKGWNGQALIIENIDYAKEPEFDKREKEKVLEYGIVGVFLLAVLYNILFINKENISFQNVIYLIVDTLGLYFSFLTLNVTNNNTKKKLCSIFTESNCERVHNSKAATLFGKYSLGELGITYFLSNIIVQIYFREYAGILIYINMIAIIFAIWSIIYQKFILRAWCSICLLVQLLIILKIILYTLFGKLTYSELLIPEAAFVLSAFIIVFYLVTQVYKLYVISLQYNENEHKLAVIKSNKNLFETLLFQKQHYDTEYSTSIIFGNEASSNELTILLNPFCGPCSLLHKKLEKLLETDILARCKIRFVFAAYTEEKEKVIVAFIGFYKNNSQEESLALINDWYRNQNLNKIMKIYENYKDNTDIRTEMILQNNWMAKCKLTSTPVILYNGYTFPEEYSLTDLKYQIN